MLIENYVNSKEIVIELFLVGNYLNTLMRKIHVLDKMINKNKFVLPLIIKYFQVHKIIVNYIQRKYREITN